MNTPHISGGPAPGGSSSDKHSEKYELVQFNVSYSNNMGRLSKPRPVEIAQNAAQALQHPEETS